MKTIRSNCFETNSSSSHSITIESNSGILTDVPSLEVDNVLYPGRINDPDVTAAFYTAERGRWTFKASTKSTKAALFVHYIYSILEVDDLDWQQLIDVMTDLAAYMGYDSINFGPPQTFYTRYTISSYSDDTHGPEIDKMLEYIGRSIQGNKILIDMQKLGLHVQSIVLDDTKTIIDVSEEY